MSSRVLEQRLVRFGGGGGCHCQVYDSQVTELSLVLGEFYESRDRVVILRMGAVLG